MCWCYRYWIFNLVLSCPFGYCLVFSCVVLSFVVLSCVVLWLSCLFLWLSCSRLLLCCVFLSYLVFVSAFVFLSFCLFVFSFVFLSLPLFLAWLRCLVSPFSSSEVSWLVFSVCLWSVFLLCCIFDIKRDYLAEGFDSEAMMERDTHGIFDKYNTPVSSLPSICLSKCLPVRDPPSCYLRFSPCPTCGGMSNDVLLELDKTKTRQDYKKTKQDERRQDQRR